MSAARSKSVPASRNIDRTLENESQSTVFPTLPVEIASDQRVPAWVQELANARAGRHSRASSIVSTRTRFSTTTFDDARSIDIQAGGQTFRIGRYGDKVTDTTAPPPYPGPSMDDIFVHHLENVDDESSYVQNHTEQLDRLEHETLSSRRLQRRVRITMPGDEDTHHSNDNDSVTADTPSRVLSDDELRQLLLDLPVKLKNALGIDPDNVDVGQSSFSYRKTPDSDGVEGKDMAGDEAATSTHSSTLQHNDKSTNASNLRSILRNAPENPPYQVESHGVDHEEAQTVPIGQSATQRLWNTYRNTKIFGSATQKRSNDSVAAPQHDLSETTDQEDGPSPEEIVIPPTVGDLNELSQVYNKVIRELDHEHRRQLHERDKELDQLRILLHEKDIVYRQQLKGKDFVIEDLKARLDRLEETMQLKIEQAAHEVEDIWETRWREHSEQLMQKCGLIKPALQTYKASSTQTDA